MCVCVRVCCCCCSCCCYCFKVRNNITHGHTHRPIFRTTRSAHVTPILHSLHWLPIDQRIEYKLSFLVRLPSTFQNFFTFTLLPGSSAFLDTRVFRIPSSEQSPVISALSLTRLQLSGTAPFLSVILPLSVLLNLPSKPLPLKKHNNFSSVPLP